MTLQVVVVVVVVVVAVVVVVVVVTGQEMFLACPNMSSRLRRHVIIYPDEDFTEGSNFSFRTCLARNFVRKNFENNWRFASAISTTVPG